MNDMIWGEFYWGPRTARAHSESENGSDAELIGFNKGARWQRGELRTEDAVRQAAQTLYYQSGHYARTARRWEDEPDESEWCLDEARAVINSLLGTE